jgi:LmbE family N-acetylglucosaminyl deacetylase
MAESPISVSCHCLSESLNFTPPGERSEEIDIVAAIGSVVLIGEAKCFLEPTEPKQFARHRDKVIDAVRQVSRKADAVGRNKEQFRTRMQQVGFSLPTEFEVQPPCHPKLGDEQRHAG